MEAHEKGIKAARAGVSKAGELGLPSSNPATGVAHDYDKQLARLEAIILGEVKARKEEAKETAKLRGAVLHWSGRTAWIVRLFIVLVIVLAAAGGLAYDRISKYAKQNREGIRVGCILLTNAILETGAGGNDQPARTPAAKAQRENTQIYVGAIVRRLLTSEEREKLAENAAIIAKSGGVVSTPDCDEIAAHPERVKRLVLGKTAEAARRSPATSRPHLDRPVRP